MQTESSSKVQDYRGFTLVRHASGDGTVLVFTCLGQQVKETFPSFFDAQQAVDTHHKQNGQSLTP